MKSERVLFSIFLAVWLPAICHGARLEIEETELSESELKDLQTLAKYDKELFHYTNKARRYYEVEDGSESKFLKRTEVIFEMKDDYYFGEYVSYTVTIESGNSGTIVSYRFYAGTSFFGDAVAMITPLSDVIRTTRTCGTDGCATDVYRNSEAIYKEQTH